MNGEIDAFIVKRFCRIQNGRTLQKISDLHAGQTACRTIQPFPDPFSKKRWSPLDPMSKWTLIVQCLTISLLLVCSGGGWASFRHFLDQFRSNFFNLDCNLVFLALTLALALIELLLALPYKCITATTTYISCLCILKSFHISPIAIWDRVHDFNRTGLSRL